MPASASPPSRGEANARRCAVCAASSCTRSLRRRLASNGRSTTSAASSARSSRPRSCRSTTASVLLSGALEERHDRRPDAGSGVDYALDKALQVEAARAAGLLVPPTTIVDVGRGARGEGVPGVREAGQRAVRGGRPAHATDGQRRRRRRGARARRRRGMASAAPRPAAARRSRRGRLRDRHEGRRHRPQRAPPRADAEPAGLGLVGLRVDRGRRGAGRPGRALPRRRSAGRACSWSSCCETPRVEPGSWS